ncbi:MAG: hypothetical protein HN742_25225 [Lentisphaerae bacterium]|jgi:hypothetical protein|nr:hypothetical protein [Lentisphaerota bacterium]MBT4817665.1 hypothetical protein [Lentisphaerota bacterium]MBT5607583.1 hypothetical protein [Lentisphaerota bacterium]MBT7054556.1 hypothetical protein [Lentisphaerota bacterium]MBT7845204.1 hypothetical protein [Lentisphaerota bacterium]
MSGISHADYVRTLSPWINAARPYLYRLPEAPERMCYGLGNHGHWALQANNTALSAFAVLAVDPATDPVLTGMSRDELLATALGMLRFALHSHHAGDGGTTDGDSWGHSWISALCLERVMHAVEALDAHLTDQDRDMLRRMLISESNWLMDHYEIVAGEVKNNKPESNMWNGALLHRTALLYPDAQRADEYGEKGTQFLVNATSIPSDAGSAALIEGRPVSEWHVGANFFESYACNHHGYMNVGYIVITLSNAAMLHFSYRNLGVEAPEALYHHLQDVWPLVKTCTFPDGRLMRIGGDTRVRYCYCQDYCIPVWLMMRDRYGDADCEAFESGWLKQVSAEMAANDDGTFMGERLRCMEDVSPLYFTRLEGDKAVTLSMGAYWRRRYAEFADVPVASEQPEALEQWEDDYHGATMVKGPRRAASWIWCAAERPQGLCLPPDASDMAEWRTNLAGRVAGAGLANTPVVESHNHRLFPGGFANCGTFRTRAEGHFAEGEMPQDVARTCVAFAALPDGRTVVGLQRATALNRAFLREVKGMLLQIPNDIFNGKTRRYFSGKGVVDVAGCDGVCETLELSSWMNIDDRMGVVALHGGESLLVHRPGKRQIAIKSGQWYAHATYGDAEAALYADEICLGKCHHSELASYDAGTALFDIGFALLPDTGHEETRVWREQADALDIRPCPDDDDVRCVIVPGVDGQVYAVAANFSDASSELLITGCGDDPAMRLTDGRSVAAQDDSIRLELPPVTCEVFRL